MKFSEKLMNLRKGKGWSQDEFAQKLNITRQTVSKWELDQTVPDMNKLIEISKLFEISLDELVNGIEESNSDSTYKESAREKNNRKIAIKIFVVGIIISCIIMGIGLIRQKQANKNNEEAYKKAYELTEEKVKNARIRISEIANEMEKLNNQIDEKNKEISSLKNEVSDLTNEKSKIFWEDEALSERYYSKDKIANEKK